MLMPRIVNTKPCNLQSAFVIFTSNFSCSAARVPHMKTEESQGSRGMRRAKNGHTKMDDGGQGRHFLIYVSGLHVTGWRSCLVYALSGLLSREYCTCCKAAEALQSTRNKHKTHIFHRSLLRMHCLFCSRSPHRGLNEKYM